MIWQMLTSGRRRRQLYSDPAAVQEQLLRSLIRAGVSTEFGRNSGFSSLARARDLCDAWRRQIPLRKYADYEPLIDRIRHGEANVLWPGSTSWFVISGGTTAGKKLIPQTAAMRAGSWRFRLDAAATYAEGPGHGPVFRYPGMGLSGVVVRDPEHPELVIGEMSGLMVEYLYRRTPRFLRRRVERNLGSAEERYESCLERKMDLLIDRSVDRDIHWMIFAPSWGLMLLQRAIQRVNEVHGRRVRSVREIWPNLKLIMTGARPLATYRPLLEAAIGDPGVDFQELYGASEGSFAFQDDLADPGLLLHTAAGVYFEFVPLENYGESAPPRLTLADVFPERPYVLHITNSGGLWAYDTGDIVVFKSLNPPRLVVQGRAIEILNSVGEFLTAVHIRQALQSVCHRLGCALTEVHGSVQPMTAVTLHHHQWAVEWSCPPQSAREFALCLDEELTTLSVPYRDSRRNRRLGAPEVLSVPEGTFAATLQCHAQASVQTKTRLVSEDRTFLERLLATAASRELSTDRIATSLAALAGK